jgi:sigma-B regulation protein RsbU (phosphoserine phosphatase)
MDTMKALDQQAWLEATRQILDRSHLWQPNDVAATITDAVARMDLTATIYLVDQEQRTLRAVPVPGRDDPAPEPVDGSIAGRTFALVRAHDAAGRWWVPIVNGTDRMGVVDYVLPPGLDPHAPRLRERCERLAGLIGHLITTASPRGDHLQLVRRSQPMSRASELLWQLLPPLTLSCERLTVSAILEPSYAVGGDGFDYAIDGSTAHLAILDAVGKGLRAGLATAVTLATLRAVRRDGGDLYEQARATDAALLEQFTDARFVTAFLGELDLETGTLRYLNAGHPAPLLLRRDDDITEITGGGRMPLGLDDDHGKVAEQRLERGDRILLYTDGITEARDTDGEQFGRDRLARLAEEHDAAGLPAPETLRRLSHAVADHQHGPPVDDATLVLAEWSPDAAQRTVP